LSYCPSWINGRNPKSEEEAETPDEEGVSNPDVLQLQPTLFNFTAMKLKYIIIGIVIAALGSIIYGYTLDLEEQALAHKFIGAGTLSLFLIAMPLFLYKESKHRNWDDYMLNDKNVRKMQGRPQKESENE
jgi:hypothetical protein